MKWLLIVTALNMEAVYPDADTCSAAAFAITKKMEHTAVCIPKPEQSYNIDDRRMEIILNNFVAIIRQFREEKCYGSTTGSNPVRQGSIPCSSANDDNVINEKELN